ncbi:hypothetical protein [Clostridium sp. FP1]|uniref:hypothetical protein n=1 Tax=Clostridium sp. FP1 TaxID=2724076 RepID=UPI001CC9515F|nr:hypothetical protein [Clostridium sp. FP1]MBZ9636170.1 hypothetical protein [Clostridium sp. FP1]
MILLCAYLISSQYYKESPELLNIISPITSVIIFYFYTKEITQLLRESRKYGNKENTDIKYVYILFAIFYCLMVVLSLVKDSINEIFNTKQWLITNFTLDKTNVDLLFKLTWSASNSLKESILAAIIFDTAFQMFNYDIKDEQRKYLNLLTENGKLYALPEEKSEKYPKVWYIRGDACSDLVDNLGIHKFSISNKYNIDCTNDNCYRILMDRKKLNLDDKNCCYHGGDSDYINGDYYFYFVLIDFENCFQYGISKEDIYNIIRNKLIEFPSGLKVYERNYEAIIDECITEVNIYRDTL